MASQLHLEMDPKNSAEFSVGADEESEMSTNATTPVQLDKVKQEDNSTKEEKAPSVSASASASNLHSGSSLIQGDETVSIREDSVVNLSSSKPDKGRKSTAHVKDPSGKRKVKVDWTPELHRKFVEAVEHLGVDKAVPSKILELMGIDCLTRHNVASHLQKYRSHRKHLLAREAEAATWTRRRQVYGSSAGRTGRRDAISCVAPPTAGFPPHFRPLHVWGHPSVDQSLVSIWPSHLGSSPCAWAPPGDPSFWYCHPQDVPAPGTPCYPPSFLPPSFPSPAVPGVPPAPMYRLAPTIGVPIPPDGQTVPKPPFDSHPSKESIDAVIGDVLSKPWLPLPLGLKPPSTDSVVVELQRQGISKIPPSCA